MLAKIRQARDRGYPGGRYGTGNWLRTWLGVVARTAKPCTLKTYRTQVGYALGSFGAVKLADLSPEHMERLYDQLTRRGLSALTVRCAHNALRAALNEAERRGLLKDNRAAGQAAPCRDGRSGPAVRG